MEREQKFTEDRAKLYAAEILLALEDLHKREIVYGNLRTSSVVINEDGHVMLSDIGLSSAGIINLKNKTAGNNFSVLYAPEVLKGQLCNKATDWYCFGVFIHEMLVGKPPFWSKNK